MSLGDIVKGNKFRMTAAVLGPELLIAPPCALGAVYVASRFAPDKVNWLTEIVTDHIVEPHLKWFESLSGSLKKAHLDYDAKKREQMIARGEPVPAASETPVTSPHERARLIANVLTKGAIAIAADGLVTLGAQKVFAKALKVPIRKSVAFSESLVHVVGIATMAGPLAAQGENVHYWIKHKLEQHGVDKARADELGTAYPYIVMPGQFASLASLALAVTHNNKLEGALR